MDFELREHQRYAGYYPDIRFLKPEPSVLRIDSLTHGWGSIGWGYCFRNFNRAWLHGKRVRVRWKFMVAHELYGMVLLEVTDGHYDRESMTDFPIGSDFVRKGSGQLKLIAWRNVPTEWETVTSDVLDLTGGTEEECCLIVYIKDSSNAEGCLVELDFIEILDADYKTVRTEPLDDDVHMDVTGTFNDYGYISEDMILKIKGVTRDAERNPLGNCPVWLFRTVDKTFLEDKVSDGNGNYEFVVPDNVTEHYLLSHKDGVPNVFGRTDRDIKGVEE